MKVKYYYDWTGNLSDDGEGGLVQLCKAHATEQGEGVQLAQSGDLESACELCNASNDPDYQQAISEMVAAHRGQ